MGILDGFVGKVGTVVGSFWKGMRVLRAYNAFPGDPDTPAQRLARTRLALLGNLSGCLRDAIRLGLHDFVRNAVSTESGSFVKLNYGHLTGNTPTTLQVQYEQLTISCGPVADVQTGAPNFDEPGMVAVKVTDNHADMPSADAQDSIYVVAYTPDLNESAMTTGEHLRGAPGETQSIKLAMPSRWQGERVHVYVFVKAAAMAKHPSACSDTVYCGAGDAS